MPDSRASPRCANSHAGRQTIEIGLGGVLYGLLRLYFVGSHPAAHPTHARPLPLQYYRDLRRAAGKKAFFRAMRALAPQLQYLRRAGGFPPSPKLDGWVEEGREGGGERLGKTPKRSLRRYDTDGGLYTKADFVWEYGGTAEWDAAKRQLAARAAPQAQMQPPP